MQHRQTVSGPQTPGVRVPTLFVGRSAWDMVQTYVSFVGAVEINGFGYIKRGADGNFYWDTSSDVFITRQEVTPSSANNSGSVFARAVHQSMVDGREDELRLQWHSHVWGGAYHSPTDMATIESYAGAGMDWFVSVVTNKLGSMTARLDVFRPVRIGAPMEIRMVSDVDPVLMDRATTDIERLVTVVPPAKQPGNVLARVLGGLATRPPVQQ
jgi:hypothetical protein